MTGIEPTAVTLEDGNRTERVATRTALWAAGVKASRLGEVLEERAGAKLDRAGRVLVEGESHKG